MSETKKIKTALVSVYHKDGLDEIIRLLAEDGVEFLSTGGTRHFIEDLGYKCHAVEDLTGYPSILGGRVKTLHPKVSSESVRWYPLPPCLGRRPKPGKTIRDSGNRLGDS